MTLQCSCLPVSIWPEAGRALLREFAFSDLVRVGRVVVVGAVGAPLTGFIVPSKALTGVPD